MRVCPEFPTKRYQIIYADPPWSMQTTSQVPSGRPNRRPYSSMRLIDILDLPIQSITARNCACFLWGISPLLPEALFTLKTWGFEYKTVAFTWVKRNRKSSSWFWGMGWWTRSNPEFCLLGTKGNPKRMSANIHSVIDTPIGEHSKKPDEVRNKIVELCGDLTRIELFARQKFEGWDVWGLEAPNNIQKLLEVTT